MAVAFSAEAAFTAAGGFTGGGGFGGGGGFRGGGGGRPPLEAPLLEQVERRQRRREREAGEGGEHEPDGEDEEGVRVGAVPADAGPLANARSLEEMVRVWLALAQRQGRTVGFALSER